MRTKLFLTLFLLSLSTFGSDFITKWYAANTITLPLTVSGVYNFTVDWGDGSSDSITSYNQNEITHIYATEGEYTVTISGKIQGWAFAGSENARRIIEITQWGSLEIDTSDAFNNCRGLTISATDSPNISKTTSLRNMFKYCFSLTDVPGISNWDISHVTDLSYMFLGLKTTSPPFAIIYNEFNGDLSDWDVSNVTDMSGMFSYSLFGGDLSNWDVSSVTNMSNTFYESRFNGDLSNWDVSSVTNMSNMFYLSSFTGDVSNWDVSSVTNMSYMFYGALFTGDVSNWDVSSVTNMSYMFAGFYRYGFGFPPPYLNPFRGDLSNWDVSNVTDMSYMFYLSLFNGDLSGWSLNSNVSVLGFLRDSELTSNNYDALLLSFLEQGLNSIVFSGGSSRYTLVSEEARNRLINEFGWSISDGGLSEELMPRYRVYNPNDGHHHYTTAFAEYDFLRNVGWNDEGVSCYIYLDEKEIDSTLSSSYYRTYNPNSGEHFWTVSENEYNFLGTVGWNLEGIDGHIFTDEVTSSTELYRLYNLNSGYHHWTVDLNERNVLISYGWNDEGIAGYVFP